MPSFLFQYIKIVNSDLHLPLKVRDGHSQGYYGKVITVCG